MRNGMEEAGKGGFIKKRRKGRKNKRKGGGGWSKGMKESGAGGRLLIEQHQWHTSIYAA